MKNKAAHDDAAEIKNCHPVSYVKLDGSFLYIILFILLFISISHVPVFRALFQPGVLQCVLQVFHRPGNT